MLSLYSRPSLLATSLGLALVAAYCIGQTALVRPHQKPPQPYTAEFKITSVHTLANGTTITRDLTEIDAVDQSGRTLTVTKDLTGSPDRPTITRARVHDPVEGTDTSWDSLRTKTTIVKGPPADQHQGCWATEAGLVRWQFGKPATSEAATKSAVAAPPKVRTGLVPVDLGDTTIEGVVAHGTRHTWTTPVGEIGNDAPLVRTEENWYASSISLLLRSVSDDPQTGKRTRELVSMSLTEPDPALFQPPEGYEVVTETAHPVPCP